MAEEAKKEQLNLRRVLKVLLGLIIVLIGIGLLLRYFWHFKVLVAGCIGPLLILVGLITVAIARE